MKTLFQISICYLLLLGCRRSVTNHIADWELLQNDCVIHQIHAISELVPIFGADSLEWLQAENDSLFRSKIAILNQQRFELDSLLRKSMEEYQAITNPVMKKAYLRALNGIEFKISKLNQLLDIYNNHLEQTQFGLLNEKLRYYQMNREMLLGYWVQVNFSGVQGELPVSIYQKKYIFDCSKQKVVETDRMIKTSRLLE
jgi:hypothetical protein